MKTVCGGLFPTLAVIVQFRLIMLKKLEEKPLCWAQVQNLPALIKNIKQSINNS